ncbi:MAG: hypothetical protein NXH97_05570 [Rhodobacteraceae bacterium]|nr:hypothetical protein [Paracoccaceae bacterium]
MDELTRLKVARFAVTNDWRPFYTSLTHPHLIRDAVIMKTGYRFHPEDAPAPPRWEDFSDDEIFELALEEWLSELGRQTAADLALGTENVE